MYYIKNINKNIRLLCYSKNLKSQNIKCNCIRKCKYTPPSQKINNLLEFNNLSFKIKNKIIVNYY